MKESIAELVPRFNSNRMVKEYCEDAYSPALGRCHELADKNCAAAKQLAAWKTLVRKNWESVKITSIKTGDARSIAPGSELDIAATVSLGPLTPNDIEVQVYFGPLRSDGSIAFSGCESLEPDPRSDGTLYRGRVVFPDSGRYGYTVRIMPYHPLLGNALKMGLVHWASVSISTQ